MKEPVSGAIKKPNTVWVNQKGRRFIDESAGLNIFETGNAAFRRTDKIIYTILNDRIRQDWGKKDSLPAGSGVKKKEDRE